MEVKMGDNIISELHQPNITIDRSGDLTLYEERTYITCLQKARKMLEKDYDIELFKVPQAEFIEMLELSDSEIRPTSVKEALTSLVDKTVKYNITGQNKKIKREGAFSMLSEFEVEKFEKEATVSFGLPTIIKSIMTGQIKQARNIQREKDGLPLLEEDKLTDIEKRNTDSFTTRKIINTMKVDTVPAVKLLGMIERAKESKYMPKLTIKQAKEILGVGDKYVGRWKDFEKFVLIPAINEATEKSDYDIRYEIERTGESAGKKNPTGRPRYITFRFKKKPRRKIEINNADQIGSVYEMIELIPKSKRGLKTLKPVLEKAIIQYDKDFVLQQLKYTLEHARTFTMSYFKKTLTEEEYDNYLVNLPETVDPVKEEPDKQPIEIDINDMMKIFTVMTNESNSPKEREEARIKLLPFKAMLKDFPEEPFYIEETKGQNDHSEEEILEAMKKCCKEEKITFPFLEGLRNREDKTMFNNMIKKYL